MGKTFFSLWKAAKVTKIKYCPFEAPLMLIFCFFNNFLYFKINAIKFSSKFVAPSSNFMCFRHYCRSQLVLITFLASIWLPAPIFHRFNIVIGGYHFTASYPSWLENDSHLHFIEFFCSSADFIALLQHFAAPLLFFPSLFSNFGFVASLPSDYLTNFELAVLSKAFPMFPTPEKHSNCPNFQNIVRSQHPKRKGTI